MDFQTFRSIAQEKGYKSQKELAKKLKVTEQTISSWKKNNFIPAQYQSTFEPVVQKQKELVMAERNISYLHDTIDTLKSRIKELENSHYMDEFLMMSVLEGKGVHVQGIVHVRFKGFSIERSFIHFRGLKNIVKILGRSEKELIEILDIGNWYQGMHHPFEKKLLHSDSVYFIAKQTLQFRNFVNIIKSFGTSKPYPMAFDLTFIDNKGNDVPCFVVNIIKNAQDENKKYWVVEAHVHIPKLKNEKNVEIIV